MSDLNKTIQEASARIVAAQQERAAREKSALAHEQAAREDRLAMTGLKKEIEELNTVLRHAGVQKAGEDAASAAKKAQIDAEASKGEADKVLARLSAKEKELDAKLAELSKPLQADPIKVG